MSANRLVAIAVLAACVGAGCSDEAEQAGGGELSGQIGIAGSSTVYPITAAMAEEFMRLHPGVKINVTSSGTGGGFTNFFIPGQTEINNASRPISESEIAAARANGIVPIELPVGIDALTVVANNGATWVESMTFDQLRRIWGPENPPQRWSQVEPTWPDAPFELYGPAPTSGTFDYFTEVIMGEEDLHRPDYHKTEHDNTIVQGVEGNPHALGYFGFAYYDQNRGRLRAIAIDGGDGPVAPSLEAARSGAYPLSRPLFIYVSERAIQEPHVRAFVEFYVRNAATDLVSQVGYVPITNEMMRESLRKIGVTEE